MVGRTFLFTYHHIEAPVIPANSRLKRCYSVRRPRPLAIRLSSLMSVTISRGETSA